MLNPQSPVLFLKGTVMTKERTAGRTGDFPCPYMMSQDHRTAAPREASGRSCPGTEPRAPDSSLEKTDFGHKQRTKELQRWG